jgi:hypothetical protein
VDLGAVEQMKLIHFIPNIKVVRKVWKEEGLLRIELGRCWEIIISREFAETYSREQVDRLKFNAQDFKSRWFIRLIKDGEILPFWYGYAHYSFDRDCAVYIPVPLNFIVAGARWLKWKWFQFKGLSRKFNSTQDAYARGRHDGFNDARLEANKDWGRLDGG